MPLNATSISFLSPVEGWVVGFASGPPADAVQAATTIEVARTSDGGVSWSGIVTVTALAETAPQPVIHFQDALHGWIWGPGIFETHDGGQTWKSADVAGLVVSCR